MIGGCPRVSDTPSPACGSRSRPSPACECFALRSINRARASAAVCSAGRRLGSVRRHRTLFGGSVRGPHAAAAAPPHAPPARARTAVGHADLVALVRVHPDLANAAVQHRGRQPLLQLERDAHVAGPDRFPGPALTSATRLGGRVKGRWCRRPAAAPKVAGRDDVSSVAPLFACGAPCLRRGAGTRRNWQRQ